MAIITDKTVKSKYPPKQTNVTWIDTSQKPAVTKSFIDGKWEVVGGGGGTTDYSELTDKPTINGVELDGNKTSSELGVYSKPSNGIPSTDLTSSVQTSLGKADTAYQKPSSGIPESDLSFDVQQALQKHFKGWYDSSSNLPSSPVVGDYAYVKGATSSDPAAIYECTTAGTWSDSGRTADTSNVQTFASSEEVNETYIDDTHLVNPTDGALPTAEDTMQLNAKLEGATAREIKPSSNLINNYKISDGTNAATNGTVSSSASKYCIIDVTGYNLVRFNGLALRSELPSGNDARIGFDFGYYDNGTYKRLLYYNYDKNTTDVHATKEYNVEVPNGATHLRITCSYSNVLTSNNFYCYLKNGVGVATEEEIVELGAKVQNIKMTETPVNAILVGENQNVFPGCVLTQGSNQSILPYIYKGFGEDTKYIVIDVSGVDYLRFIGIESNYTTVGYAFYDETNKQDGQFLEDNTGVISFKTFDANSSLTETKRKEYIVKVPSGAKYFKTSFKHFVKIQSFYCYKQNGSPAAPLEDVDNLLNVVGDYNTKTVEKLYFRNPRYKGYINNNGVLNDSQYNYATQYYIPVEGALSIEMNNATFASDTPSTCYAFYTDSSESNLLLTGTFAVTPETTTKHYKIEVPTGAKYFRTTIVGRSMNVDAVARYDGVHVVYPDQTISDEVNNNTNYVNNDNVRNIITKRPFFYSGNLDTEGRYTKNDNTIISGIIEAGRGFFLKVFDEYEIHSAHLVTLGGDLLCYNFRPTNDVHIGHIVETPQIYSTFAMPAQFGIMVVVCRVDGKNIDKNESIVKEFNYLDDETKFVRLQKDGYNQIHYRLNQVMKIYSKFLAPLSNSNINPNDTTRYFNQLSLVPSVCYSDVFLTNNFIGLSISFLTYLTALMNPYSVIYTENINAKKSHYGIDYNDSDWYGAIRAFGISCYSAINYLFGLNSQMQIKDLPQILGSSNASSHDISAFDDSWFNNLEVFDCISDPMHVVIITDIIEINGVRKYVVVSEFSGFGGYSTVYDKDSLIQRFTQYITPSSQYYYDGWTVESSKIIRYKALSNIQMPALTPFIQQNQNDFEIPIETSHDISTYYGDYAAFLKDGDIWLNVRRNNLYNKVKIIDPNNNETYIDISSIASDTYYYDNNDDWISIKLTTGISVVGKYEAFAVKDDGNDVVISTPTHFEILEIANIDFSIAGSTVTYSAEIYGGDCISIRCEKPNGRYYVNSVRNFETNTGSIEGTTVKASGYNYLKFIVKGDYGVVVKRIDMSV